MTTFTVATNDFRGGGERTEYHPCVAWDRLAEICGQFLSKGQLVDVEGRLQTRQWDDDAGKRQWVSAPGNTPGYCRFVMRQLVGSAEHCVDGHGRGTIGPREVTEDQ